MDLIITKEAYLKLKYYIGLVDTEISGMGKSHIDKDGDIILSDVIIFHQEVSGSSTDLDEASMAKFLSELMKKGEKTEEWNVWWHSHADMDVFWSSTDDDTIAEHCNHQSHLISLVGNRKGKFKARLDLFPKDTSPFNYQEIHYKEDVDVKIEEDDSNTDAIDKLEDAIEKAYQKIDKYKGKSDPAIQKACQKEIDDKVTEYVVPNKVTNKWSWTGDNQDAITYDNQDWNGSHYKNYYDDYYGGYEICIDCGYTLEQCAKNKQCPTSEENDSLLKLNI